MPPNEEMVKEAPDISAGLSLPSRAFLASSPISCEICMMPFLSASLIDQTAVGHEPIYITGKRSSAVLVAEEDWRAIQETLYLLAVPGMREAIKAGMAEPLDQSSKALDW